MNKCQNCRWFYGDVNGGECHKRAPIPITDEIHFVIATVTRNPYPNEIVSAWPFVSTQNFCGDFEVTEKENA